MKERIMAPWKRVADIASYAKKQNCERCPYRDVLCGGMDICVILDDVLKFDAQVAAGEIDWE